MCHVIKLYDLLSFLSESRAADLSEFYLYWHRTDFFLAVILFNCKLYELFSKFRIRVKEN